MDIVRVRTFYPADPAGIVPGGVDTFIRGMIKFAPEDIHFSLIGMTTDTNARPLKKWTRCNVGGRDFCFFPVVHVTDAGKRSRIPLSLRYTLAVASAYRTLRQNFDIFEFHRIEPALLFKRDPRPKNAFFHTNMSAVRDPNTDMIWRYAPSLYEYIERGAIARLSSIWSVRIDAVETMRNLYPRLRDNINFIPTWVDTEVFSPRTVDTRVKGRAELAATHGLDPSAVWIVSVGRLDHSKDPELLVSAVSRLVAEGENVNLLLVGDGVLRETIQSRAKDAGILTKVSLLGLKSPEQVAQTLTCSDVFALSSAYEGMPMALLEALGCGLPVATTDVGEVRRVVSSGVNGTISINRTVEAFSACLTDVVRNRLRYGGKPAIQAIQRFRPSEVLEPVYENYRKLAHGVNANDLLPRTRI